MDPRKTDYYSVITFLIFCYVSKACLSNASTIHNANNLEKTNIKIEPKLLGDLHLPAPDAPSQSKHIEDHNAERIKRQLNIIQSKIVDIVHPKPIVDTITEEEKYGNTVDHAFGRKIVKAVEGISNIINSAFAFPVNTVKKASKSATDALNQIGSKIVGLQK